MQISKHTVALIEYTLKDDAGEILDQSSGTPLAYVHGTETLIPGLESALEGKSAGARIQVRIAPEDAYGPRDESMIHSIPRAALQGDAPLEIGMQLEAVDEDEDEAEIVTVVGIEGDEVVVDGNHPLAGVALNFDVQVIEVRRATREEISHGHVHGPGGHSH